MQHRPLTRVVPGLGCPGPVGWQESLCVHVCEARLEEGVPHPGVELADGGLCAGW